MPIFIWMNARKEKWETKLSFWTPKTVQGLRSKVIWNTHGLGKRSGSIKNYPEGCVRFGDEISSFPWDYKLCSKTPLHFCLKFLFYKMGAIFLRVGGKWLEWPGRIRYGLTVSWLWSVLKMLHFHGKHVTEYVSTQHSVLLGQPDPQCHIHPHS